MIATPIDDRVCDLGEGPLWHPERQELLWFDIIRKRLHCSTGQTWQFDQHVSAAGWIDFEHLLIADQNSLFKFSLENGTRIHICDLEADDPTTRSNDGRADPWGGFWIGTMRLDGGSSGGAIYRYYKGELRQLFAPLSITNAIAFAPDERCAYWGDTGPQKVFEVALDSDGWPKSPPRVFLDLAAENLNPDGAIVAADGSYLNAQWGASRVARYDKNGSFIEAFNLPTSHVTCPALGGPDLCTLFVTSAQQGLSAAQLEGKPDAGKTFAIETGVKGIPEYQVIL